MEKGRKKVPVPALSQEEQESAGRTVLKETKKRTQQHERTEKSLVCFLTGLLEGTGQKN